MFKPTATLALTALIITSCKKEITPQIPEVPVKPDHVAPVLTLKGSKSDTIFLNALYTDPGATATDDRDGDLVANILVEGFFSVKSIGSYQLKYKVKDAAGNQAIPATRTITVVNNVGYLTGNYVVDCHCSTGGTTNTTYNTSVLASKTENNVFSVTELKEFNGASESLAVNTLTLNPNNTYAVGAYGYSSYSQITGSLVPGKTSFTLQTSIQLKPQIGSTAIPVKRCTQIFTRQ